MNDATVYAGAAVMGAVAGIRSMSAPAVIGQLAESGFIPEGSPLALLNHPGVAKGLKFLAAGELFADKLPFLPARTDVGPLAARVVTGGISGAVVCSAGKRPWILGALIGAAAAVGASYGATKLRKVLTDEYNIPNAVVGVLEDAVVVGSSYLVVSQIKSDHQAIAEA